MAEIEIERDELKSKLASNEKLISEFKKD